MAINVREKECVILDQIIYICCIPAETGSGGYHQSNAVRIYESQTICEEKDSFAHTLKVVCSIQYRWQ